MRFLPIFTALRQGANPPPLSPGLGTVDGGSAINDDKILMACLSLCSDPTLRGDMQDLKTESLRVKRNLVLLTEDRALNIKAVAKNVPVRTVPSFARWAHLI
uniref:PIN domain-containing protein n=1 Tax=Plectus sambesii TaxID=2011161 RepID=A0A914VF97_9BILA